MQREHSGKIVCPTHSRSADLLEASYSSQWLRHYSNSRKKFEFLLGGSSVSLLNAFDIRALFCLRVSQAQIWHAIILLRQSGHMN